MPSDADASGKLNDEIYVADGDYIKDIEINDLRNRYTLTKGSTQKMVITPVVLADPPGPVLPASGCYFPFFLDFFWISFLFFSFLFFSFFFYLCGWGQSLHKAKLHSYLPYLICIC